MERGLYIVPTPIGNLTDITQRALNVLGAVDVIAAEDTRHCARLLDHYGITTPTTGYHEHSGEAATERLCQRLREGASVALISDAGTPLVSDPGFELVRAAQQQGTPVIPLPGACAAITALSASGLSTARFFFEGFLPPRQGARRQRLEALRNLPATLVFYEAPHRIEACLEDAIAVLGADREATLARELTKQFETVRRATLSALFDWVRGDSNQQRGEIVLAIAGATQSPHAQVDAEALLKRLARELPPRRAAAVVAELTGAKARELYQVLLDQSDR